MSSPPTRVACLGAGYFSRVHRDSWARIPEVVCVGACDLDRARAAATGLPAFRTLGDMLQATGPDLLDIIVPPDAHAVAIRTAIAAGVPWIICQKPFCRSLGEAREIAAHAASAGTVLIVHENFRFQPWYRAMGRAMAQGRLGSVHQLAFRLRPGDGQGPRAYLDRQPYFQTMDRFLIHETAVHWVDTFRFLMGEVVSVYADLRRLNPAVAGEDAGVVLFEHASGARSIFDGNRHLDHAARNLRCTMGEALAEGTEGTLRLSGDGALRLRAFGSVDETELLAPDRTGTFGGDCVHALQRHVIAARRDGSRPENTAAAYLGVLEIEAAIYASARSGQKIRLDRR